MGPFLIYEGYLCRKTDSGLKHYVFINNLDPLLQQQVVDTLNNNYPNLILQKTPSNKHFAFLINGNPYIEQTWSSENQRYNVVLHDSLRKDNNEQPTLCHNVKNHWINIFDDCKLVDVDPNNYYVIKYSNSAGCEMVNNNHLIIGNSMEILEKYNIFIGNHIVVDVNSFKDSGFIKDNGLVDLDEIRKTIITNYRISYVSKILTKMDLHENELSKFVEKCNCHLFKPDQHYWLDGCYFFMVIDNHSNHYELKVKFNPSDVHSSRFEIVKRFEKPDIPN